MAPPAALGTGDIIGWVVLRHDPATLLYGAEGPFTDWTAVREVCERQAAELADTPRPTPRSRPWVTVVPLYRGASAYVAGEGTPMPGDPFGLPEPPVDTVLRVAAGGMHGAESADLERLPDGWAWLENNGAPGPHRLAWPAVLAITAAERVTVVRWGAAEGRAA
jgi:hypothetical protein